MRNFVKTIGWLAGCFFIALFGTLALFILIANTIRISAIAFFGVIVVGIWLVLTDWLKGRKDHGQ